MQLLATNRSTILVAVTYEGDTSSCSIKPPSNAQSLFSGGKRGGMRLLATYRSTGLAAVMFEADGTGSVQYPNGNLWMSFTAETGKGALYSHPGDVTRTWSSADEQPVELLLDQHLVSQSL